MGNNRANSLLIKQLHDSLERQANNNLRPKDLTMMQVAVLMSLQEAEGQELPLKEIERQFQVAQSTMAGVISRLEQKGFVEALGDKSDRRIKVAHITPEGEACCREAAGYMQEAEETLLRGFSEEERSTFNRLLERAAENLS